MKQSGNDSAILNIESKDYKSQDVDDKKTRTWTSKYFSGDLSLKNASSYDQTDGTVDIVVQETTNTAENASKMDATAYMAGKEITSKRTHLTTETYIKFKLKTPCLSEIKFL